MYPFYSFCLTVGLILALPYFIYQGLVHRKYFSGLSQRLGFLPPELTRKTGKGIWVHAVSVGEFLAVLPLLKGLKKEWPERPLLVTTTTRTGQELARQKVSEFADVCYFPLDWKFSARRFLRLIRPALILIVETEIWPNFLRTCHEEGVPVLLINGRFSARSFTRYRKIGWFIKQSFKGFRFFLMQTAEDRERLITLGAPVKKVEVTGNIKYDLQPPENIETLSLEYRRLFGLNASHFVVIAGSTMKDEEPLILSAFRQLAAAFPDSKLILAPRHPERIKEVESIVASFGFPFKKRTDFSNAIKKESEDSVILLDTMGELPVIYYLADAVFVGGSLVPRGGHNIVEPALFEKPILFGPHMNNFIEISSHFLERQAALRVTDSTALASRLIELARNPHLGKQFGSRAAEILGSNRGATQKVLERVRECLEIPQEE